MPEQTLDEQMVRTIARQEAEAVTGVLRAELTAFIQRQYDDQRKLFDAMDKYLRNLEVLVTVQTEKLGTQVSALSAQLRAREDQVEKIERDILRVEDRLDNQTVLLAQTAERVRGVAADIDGDLQYPDRQPSLRRQIEQQALIADRNHREVIAEMQSLFASTSTRLEVLETWVTRRMRIEQAVMAGMRQTFGFLWHWRVRVILIAVIIALLALLGIQVQPEHLTWLR